MFMRFAKHEAKNGAPNHCGDFWFFTSFKYLSFNRNGIKKEKKNEVKRFWIVFSFLLFHALITTPKLDSAKIRLGVCVCVCIQNIRRSIIARLWNDDGANALAVVRLSIS